MTTPHIHRLMKGSHANHTALYILRNLLALDGVSNATMCLTTPATLQANAQASVQCSQGGFLFSRAC